MDSLDPATTRYADVIIDEENKRLLIFDVVGEWNYTTNCSVMIYGALRDLGIELPPSDRPSYYLADGEWRERDDPREPWWALLDGASGAEGHFLLRRIVEALEADPERFMALNPLNGWGDYENLLVTLREMRDACAVEDPNLVWEACG